ncbi:MAG TPA: prenyltransferase [Archaeoglobaceae archaeon]|nr:prenyltransferase [Archaeoglobaceae archaeon]
MKAKAVWELLRLEHGFMYGVGVVIGVFVSTGIDFSLQNLILGILTAIFLQASAFALNDYFDYEVDLANKRYDRPLIRGELSRNTAFLFFALLAPVGFLTAVMISIEAFLFAFAVTVAGFLYDIRLKEFGFAGNVYIAFSMAAPFIFGSVVATKTVVPSAALLSLLAFLSGIGREIMKGIEDVEGDAIRDVKTVARVRGVEIAARLSAIMFVLSVFLSFLPPLLLAEYFLDLKYIVPVAATDVLLILVSLNLLKGRFERSLIREYRKKTLLAMAFGLAGFFGGVF